MELTPIQQKIFNRCLEMNPSWKLSKESLKRIIVLADVDKDGYKRIVVEGIIYLVPIENIICIGLKASEVPLKYKKQD